MFYGLRLADSDFAEGRPADMGDRAGAFNAPPSAPLRTRPVFRPAGSSGGGETKHRCPAMHDD